LNKATSTYINQERAGSSAASLEMPSDFSAGIGPHQLLLLPSAAGANRVVRAFFSCAMKPPVKVEEMATKK